MRRWWTDLEAPDQPWTGLHLHVEGMKPGAPRLLALAARAARSDRA